MGISGLLLYGVDYHCVGIIRNRIVEEIDKMYDQLISNNEKLLEQYPESNMLLSNEKRMLEELKRLNLKDKK